MFKILDAQNTVAPVIFETTKIIVGYPIGQIANHWFCFSVRESKGVRKYPLPSSKFWANERYFVESGVRYPSEAKKDFAIIEIANEKKINIK